MASPRHFVNALMLAALAGCYNAATPWRTLVDNNVTTTGRVAYIDCASHGLVVYAFNAGAQEYRGKATPGSVDCGKARIGDPLLVYFAPADPSTNTLLNPADAYARERGWRVPDGTWIALGCTWVIGLSLFISTRRRRA